MSKAVVACRINTEGVIHQVKMLFHGHIELILGFNTFLPKVCSTAFSFHVVCNKHALPHLVARVIWLIYRAGLRNYHARLGTRGGQGVLSHGSDRRSRAAHCKVAPRPVTGRSHRPVRHSVLTLLFAAAKAACGVRSGYQLCEQNQGRSNEHSDTNANKVLLWSALTLPTY